MRLIAITRPDFFAGEEEILCGLPKRGFELIHMRKPLSSLRDCESLLKKLPVEMLSKIVLHDHFGLAEKYGVFGVHINSRNPLPPSGWRGSVSCSCHSLAEVGERKAGVDYLFLSPVFDSISKKGYSSEFTLEQLEKAVSDGLIDGKVFALGGVTFNRVPLLEKIGFGGAAMLGEIWNR